MFSDHDHRFMSRAIELAGKAMYTTTPNPRVGCVVVKDRQIVGEGWHERAGEEHAEVAALRNAGHAARGATVYVSLEPCSHQGATGPCSQALIEAQVGCVFAAMEDPNPAVSGNGLRALREAGIEVRCGLLQREAVELNPGYLSRMRYGLPWVRLKVACSLDGMTALPDGSSQWITDEPARADGHHWRARACAILTGIGTVRDDDPQMNVRLVQTERQPIKVIVDSRLEIDPAAKIMQSGAVIIACAVENAARQHELTDRGAQVLVLPDTNGKVDLKLLMKTLGSRGINECHVEAGFKLNGSLIREDCVDELLWYVAPSLLGQATGVANLEPVATLTERRQLSFHAVTQVGGDLRIQARFEHADRSITESAGDDTRVIQAKF